MAKLLRHLKYSALFILSCAIFSCSGSSEGVAPNINELPSLSDLVISPNAITLAVNNTTTFTASGGSGSYSYSIFSGSGSVLSTTGSFTAPGVAGTTVVRVVDGAGRYADAIVTTNAALEISPTSLALGLNQDTTFTTTGGVSPIVFSVVSGGGSIDSVSGAFNSGSTVGACVVRATDALGNTSESNINIYGALGISPKTITIAVNNTVDFSAGGGVLPYLFSLFSGGGSVNSSSGLYTAPSSAGTATVRVTDDIGNFDNAVITINAALAISPTSQIININDSVTFSATDGVAPYTFSLISGTGSINSASGLYTAPSGIGSAVIRVTDSYGNTADANVTITSPLSISPTAITIAVNNTTSFTGSGGTPPLTYSVVSGGGSINSSTGSYTAGSSSGTAVVRVTDSLGATADANVTINPALSISPATQTMAINGTLSFSSAGGVAPYTYSVQSGSGSINSSTGSYTAPPSTGTDVVRVTDSLGNIADSTVTINNSVGLSPAAITLAVNNTTTFSATGGAPPYSYSIQSGGGSINSSSGFFTAPSSAGSVTVRVTDSLSNFSDGTVTVNAALAISPTSKTLAVNNVFSFSATGGVSPFSYSVVSGGGTINASTGAYTAPSSSGSATVRVTDSYGNTSNATVTINNALAIAPSTATITTVDTYDFNSTGGTGGNVFSIVSGGGSINSSTGVYTPASTGAKTIRVTDSQGNTSNATLTVNSVLSIVPSSAYVVVDGTQVMTFSGGVPPVSYSVLSGGGSFIDPEDGTYSAPSSSGSAIVQVEDSMGHTSSATLTIYNALTISPTTVTVAVNASQAFVGSGGYGALNYTMFSGNGSINSSTGVYTASPTSGAEVVQVTDSIGNTAEANITVVSNLTISPSTLKLPVFSTANFSAILGTPPYTYSILSGSGSILASGTYTAPSSTGSGGVRVTDVGSNVSDASITHIKPVQISVGDAHTCARYNEGSVKCWGSGANGRLGSGATSSLGDNASEQGGAIPFVNLGSGRTATSIALGSAHSCALLDNATIKCWGLNSSGQLGQGHTNNLGDGSGEMGDNLAAINLGTGRTATAVYAFGAMTCAKLDNASVKCWGQNTYGQLGLGDVNSRGDQASEMGDNLAAIDFGTGRTAASMHGGISFLCARLDNGTAKCFGRNNRGQLGQGHTNSLGDGAGEMGDSLAAISLGTGRTVVSMRSGYEHSCALLDDSTVKCWGRNDYGQLGKGNTNNLGDGAGEMGDSLTAISLGTGFTASSVYAGRRTSCAMTSAGTIKCWGYNGYGQLLIGSTSTRGDGGGEMGDSLVAASYGTGFTPVSLDFSYYHLCMITSNDRIKCWGYNANGQLLKGNTSAIGDSGGELGDSLTFSNN